MPPEPSPEPRSCPRPAATARFRVSAVWQRPSKHATRGPDGHIAWQDCEEVTARLIPANAPRSEPHNFFGGSAPDPGKDPRADDGAITIRSIDPALAATLRFGASVDLTIAPARD